MEFLVLGPLEVRAGTSVIPLGGPKQRALLAILLLQANRVVPRDVLIDELWPDQNAAAAEHALRVQISRLRKALAADAAGDGRLVTRAPGYVLRAEPGELDLERFERLVAEARQALIDGNRELAVARLCEADALWRGRPLADLEFEPFARVDVQRLAELRLAAIELRLEAELALGRHDALVGELETLASRHPLRERLRAQLMLALYRSGRQAEALEVYRHGRALLVEQLGLDPGPDLQELERAILRQDDALRAGAATAVAVPKPQAVTAPLPTSAPSTGRAPAAAPPRAPPRARRGTLAGLAAALVAAAVAALVLVPHGRTVDDAVHGDAVAALSADGRLGEASALPSAPTDVVVAFGSLWVSHYDTGRVSRQDPGDRTADEPGIRVGAGASGLAAGSGAVWVANSLDGSVSRIDPDTNQVVQRIAVGRRPTVIAAGGGDVWVGNADSGTVSRVDGQRGRLLTTIDVGGAPTALAVGGGSVWVAVGPDRSVLRLDPRTGTVVARVVVGGGPTAIAVGAGGVWVTSGLDGTVTRIDPAGDTVAATIGVGDGPVAVATNGSSVLVANEFGRSISLIDATRNQLRATRALGKEPVTLTAGAQRVWVGMRAQGPSHRGGRLVALNPDPAFDSLDPAIAHELFPTTLLGMTNDGLVTFEHVDGSAGTELVPDLAVALPSPTDAGRRYTFQLRRGLTYSTGQPVRARDVRRALERVFRLRSPGASFYDALVGAPLCLRRPARCDLARAIETDDQLGRVTFRLRAPDPELLYKLALPFAYLVPAATPMKAATKPLPATGPYIIASYRRGDELRLVRNPRFHEWSRAAQPDGYPDQITWRLAVRPDTAVDSILRGRADWMFGFGQLPPDRLREIRTRYARQVHIHNALATDYLVFNVRAPPFSDVRARRAVNYALDRRVAVGLYGGSANATPTCQVLPPQMSGYHPYCPYTGGPGTKRWRAPDLARARRLVAASGTRGARVIVLDSATPQIFLDEGRLAVTALRRLGYRARLRLVPDDVFERVAGNQRKVHSNLQSGGWGADYPAASDFIQLKLSCTAFRPGTDHNANSGGFCDPALDRMMKRARELQVADPPRANAIWARIDRALVDRAAWLPLVNPTVSDLVSRRVGNYRYHPLWGVLLDQLWVH